MVEGKRLPSFLKGQLWQNKSDGSFIIVDVVDKGKVICKSMDYGQAVFPCRKENLSSEFNPIPLTLNDDVTEMMAMHDIAVTLSLYGNGLFIKTGVVFTKYDVMAAYLIPSCIFYREMPSRKSIDRVTLNCCILKNIHNALDSIGNTPDVADIILKAEGNSLKAFYTFMAIFDHTAELSHRYDMTVTGGGVTALMEKRKSER